MSSSELGKGFLDLLKSHFTPLDLAKEAVEKDDAAALETLLKENPNITEDTYVPNEVQTKRNLMHFSVSSRSPNCLRLLSRRLGWSLQRGDVIGLNALTLAFPNGYLPILWEPLLKAPGDWRVRRAELDKLSHIPQASVVAVLDFLLWPEKQKIREMEDTVKNPEKAETNISPLFLATELLLSTARDAIAKKQFRETLGVHCEMKEDPEYADWLEQILKSPSLLSEAARRSIRVTMTTAQEEAVRDYGKSEESCQVLDPRLENYFRRIDKLPLPPSLKAFLCYQELWPVQSRDKVFPYIRRGTWNRRHFVRPGGIQPYVWWQDVLDDFMEFPE